ncbi:hypothetical protein, partial [Paraburkholderia sp. BR14374]|uniref:hypothetical protein n=1 Tax=Paraburkholderia sp. BR14374 TaxID=3237007 RepID=UPI0034CED96C
PLRLPGLCVGSDKMVSTTSKMMDITLMPILAAVYNGHREPLTVEEERRIVLADPPARLYRFDIA